MINYYILSTTVILAFLALIWNRDDFLNAFLKFILFSFTFWGGYLIFTQQLLG